MSEKQYTPEELKMSKFPSDSKNLIIQVFYLNGEEPFICGINGRITQNDLEEINGALFEQDIGETFNNGEGDYLFKVTREPGQQTFPETGQWDYPPYWQLDFIQFRPIKES